MEYLLITGAVIIIMAILLWRSRKENKRDNSNFFVIRKNTLDAIKLDSDSFEVK